MSHSFPPKSERRSNRPKLPAPLADLLAKAKKDPTDLETWDLLADQARELDRPEEVATLFEESLPALAGSPDLEEIGRRAADFCEEWFEDPKPTVDMLLLVLEIDASQAWAFDRLTVLLTATSRWDDLLSAYDRAIEKASEPAKRVQLLEEAARVARDFAGESARGTDYLIALYAQRLGDDALLTTLEKRLEEQDRPHDLIGVWLARLPTLDGANAQKQRIAIARKYLAVSELAEAEKMLLSVLEQDRSERGRVTEEAISVLELVARAAKDPITRRSPLSAILAVHRETKNATAEVGVVEWILASDAAKDDALELRERAFSLLIDLGRPEEALVHGCVLVEDSPTEAGARRRVKSLALSIDRLAKYAESLEKGAKRRTETRERIPLTIEVAEVFLRELGDGPRATALYRDVMAESDAEPMERLLATQELCTLLDEERDGAELVLVWVNRAKLEERPKDASRAWFTAARISESRAEFDAALEYYGQCLVLDSKDVEALTRRIALFERLQRPQGLVQSYLDRASAHGDPAFERADLTSAASVYEKDLGDPGSGIKIWREVEKKFGRDEESFESLLALLMRASRYEDAVNLLSEEVLGGRGERGAHLYERLGETLRLHLQQYAEAITAYARALELAPTSEVARAGLRSLLLSPEHAEEAAEALARNLLSCGEKAAILDLVDIRLAAATEKLQRNTILLEAASFAEELGRTKEACGYACQAFRETPSLSNESLARRLVEHEGEFSLLASSYEAALLVAEPERARFLWAELGRIFEARLGDVKRASLAFEEALKLAHLDHALLFEMLSASLLARRYEAAAQGFFLHVEGRAELPLGLLDETEGLFRHCDAFAALPHFEAVLEKTSGLNPLVEGALRRYLGRLYRSELGDLDRALGVLRGFALSTKVDESLELLVRFEREAGKASLVPALVSLSRVRGLELSLLREAVDYAGAHGYTGEDLETSILDGQHHAFSTHVAEPTKERANDSLYFLEEAAKLHRKRGDKAKEIELLVSGSALPLDSKVRLGLLLRGAKVAAELPSDERAVELLEAVLEAEPAQLDAIGLLSELHEKAGRTKELVLVRRRQLAATPEPAARVSLRLLLDSLLEEQGESVAVRAELLLQNLEEAPGETSSLERLDACYRKEARFAELAGIYELEGKKLAKSDPKAASECFEKAGRIAESELSDDGKLVENFRAAAKLVPSHYVLDRLGAVLFERKDSREARVHLEARLATTKLVTEDPSVLAERRAATKLLADVLESLADGEALEALLVRELEADPGDNVVRGRLVEILTASQKFEPLYALLTAGVAYAEDNGAKVVILQNAADVARRRLFRPELAVPLFESAIRLDADDKSLKLGLADTLRTLGEFDRARDELLPLIEEFGRRRTREKALIHLQLARIAEGKGDLSEALVQAEAAASIERTDAHILMMVGRIARKNGQLARAEQAYRTLLLIVSRGSTATTASAPLEEHVSESSILLELSKIASEEGQTERAGELMTSALDVAAKDPDEALRLARELEETDQIGLILDAISQRLEGAEGKYAAQLLVTKASILVLQGHADEAVFARLSAVEANPSDLALAEATWNDAKSHGFEEEAASRYTLLGRRVTEPDASAFFFLKAALHAEEFDLERCRDFLLEAQKTGSRKREVFLSLERVLSILSDEQGLFSALKIFVDGLDESVEPELAKRCLVELAGKLVERGEAVAAVARFEKALSLGASPSLVLEAFLPQLARPRARAEVVELCLRCARELGDDEKVLLCVVRSSELGAKAELLLEGIELSRELGDKSSLAELSSALITLKKEEGDLASIRDLVVERAELAIASQEATLAALLLRDAVQVHEGDEKIRLELRYAELARTTLRNAELAAQTYERLLSEGIQTREVFAPLLGIYRAAGKLDLVEAKLIELSEAVSAEDRAWLRLERAELLVLGGRTDEAEALLREILEAGTDSARPVTMLVQILAESERTAEARDLLVEQWDLAKQNRLEELTAEFGLLFARLFASEDRGEAVSILRAGLELTGANRQVLETLLSLYTDEDDADDRAEAIEKLLALESGVVARGLVYRLLELRRSTGDDYGAVRALEIGTEKVPDDADLWLAYIELLRREDDASRLISALEKMASLSSDEVEAAALLAEAAGLAENRLGEPARAAELFSKSFERDATNIEALKSAIEIWTRLGERELPLEKLAEALKQTDEMGEADLLEVRAGYVAREFSSDRERVYSVTEDLTRALTLFVSEEQAERMRRLLVELLSELVSGAEENDEPSGRRALTLSLVAAQEALAEHGDALFALTAFVREHESDLELSLRLAEKAESMGELGLAVYALGCAVRSSVGAAARNLVLKVVDLAIRAGEPASAKPFVSDACREAPGDMELRAARKKLFLVLGETKELAESLLLEAEDELDVEKKVELLLEAADLLRESGDLRQAVAVLEDARPLVREPYVLLNQLSHCYVELGELEEAKKLLETAVDGHGKKKTPELSVLQHGLSRIARASGDIEAMYSWLETALLTDRNNAEVAAELARTAQDDGRYEVAVKALQLVTLSKATSTMSKPEAYYRQAIIAEKQGDSKKALLLARRAMTTDEGYPEAGALVARLGG